MNKLLSTFTGIVKEELTTKPYDDERLRAIFSGFIKVNGRYSLSNDGQKIILSSMYSKIARFMYETGVYIFKTQASFAYRQSPRFSKRREYVVIFEHQVDRILEQIHLDFFSSGDDYLKQFQSPNLIAGFLAGVFLASGSVTHPESSDYHLEMTSEDEGLLYSIQQLLKKVKHFRFSFKLTMRQQKHVLYLKKSDEIANFLIFLGATDATLEYENIRVARDFSNSENRLQICQNANMNKTIIAAQKQIEDIKLIDEVVGLKTLDNEKIVTLCQLRLNNDSSSLEELAVMMRQQYKETMSKSNLNHMFRYIHRLATRLRGVRL
jgi:cell division protein WhiA